MTITWSRVPVGSPPKDYSKEKVVVAIVSIAVVMLPNGKYVAMATTPHMAISGDEAEYPNAAMTKLLQQIIDRPILDGQM